MHYFSRCLIRELRKGLLRSGARGEGEGTVF